MHPAAALLVALAAGQAVAAAPPMPPRLIPESESAWAGRLASAPHVFTIDAVQPLQILNGDGQEAAIARFPLVIGQQHYQVPPDDVTVKGLNRRHFDQIKVANPGIVFISYQVPFEDSLPPQHGPGTDTLMRLRQLEAAYMHDAAGRRMFVDDVSGIRAIFDPRSPDVRAALLEAIDVLMAPGDIDGIFLDDYGIMNPMVLDQAGKQYVGAPGQTMSPTDYAAKLAAMTSLSEEIRRRWPVSLFIANGANTFPAFNGELVEGSGQRYRMATQFAPVPGRVAPFVPLYQDTPVLAPSVAQRDEAQALGGWYGASHDNQHIMPASPLFGKLK